ncbi:MAG: LPS assembly lipoprotein LptE [Sedimenticolaceae bacterium]|jgi:LPS-assembly lipoprotein
MKNINAISRALWISLLIIVLTGCGFHLRGALPTLTMDNPIYIAGVDKNSDLYRELARQLRGAKSVVTETRSLAKSVLTISDYRSRERQLTLNSSNQAVEYELEESFNFSVQTSRTTVESRPLKVTRVLGRTESETLAREREEREMRINMRHDLVNQLMYQLARIN